MDQIYDEKNFLTWIKLNTKELSESISDDPNASIPSGAQRIISANKTIDKWSTYIYKDPHYVSNLYMDNFIDSSNMFYCYAHNPNNGKEFLVGVAIITPPIHKGNRADIDYILVDPRKQNQGYATRMIASISQNPEFFAKRGHKAGFVSTIREDNIPAIMSHINNDYDMTNKYTINSKINSQNESKKYSINGVEQRPKTLPTYVQMFNNPTQDENNSTPEK